MAFDAFYMSCVLQQIRDTATGARVEKIHQPSRDTVLLQLRCETGRQKLLIAANPAAPRLHFTSSSPENPDQPPMFCMLMRKRLVNAALVDVRQSELDRVLYIDFELLISFAHI